MTPERQALFLLAVSKFVEDLNSGSVRAGLRVKPYRGAAGLFETTWAPDGRAPDGRAPFSYGSPVLPGEPHVIWRRVGGHDIFANP